MPNFQTYYRQTLLEDDTSNRMEESLRLFGSVCNVKWFQHASLVLFFNKRDLFVDKLARFKIFFTDYAGDASYEGCLDYVVEKYARLNELDREVYRHVTCAKDKEDLGAIVRTVSDNLQLEMIKGLGLY